MPGLLRGIARTAVVAGTASAVAGRVQHRQQGRWAAKDQAADAAAYQQEQQMAPPPPPAAPVAAAAAPAADDMGAKLEQLQQLGELKSQGVLSEAEFETQKRRILG